jgi:hypothetical protein
MATLTVYDSPSVTVWYHEDKKIVHHQVHRFVRGEEFQAFLLAGTEALEQHKAQKWLSDDRGSPVLAQDDLTWGHDVWFPRTAAAGWRYWAIVRPEKVLARVTMEHLVKEYGAAGVTAKFFENPDDAMKWLEGCS